MARAIRFDRIGGPDVLRMEQVEVGDPGPGQARVRHSYVAVNFIDIYFRTGTYPLALPSGLGSDAIGVTMIGPVVIDTRMLATKGSLWVTRPAMVHYATPRPQMLAMARELFDHVLAGNIQGEPHQEFALEDAAMAHQALEGRKTVGATVLVP